MDANTKNMIAKLGVGLAKKVLMLQATALVSHGIITSDNVEVFVSLGLAAIGALWSFWNEYGSAIVESQLEVLKAKSLAQADKIRAAKLPQVTAAQIADQSPKLTTADVKSIAATLPAAIQGNIAADMTVAAGKAAMMVLLAVALASLVATGSAHAATATKKAVDCTLDVFKLTPACKKAAGTTATNPLDNLLAKLEQIQTDVVAGVVGDIQAADADAGTIVTPANGSTPAVVNDPISHACYPAAVQFIQSLPVAKPTTGAPYIFVQLFQKKRDFVNQIKAGLPAYLKIGCGALLGDETQIFVAMLGMVGVTVATGGLAGILPAAAPLALPVLSL